MDDGGGGGGDRDRRIERELADLKDQLRASMSGGISAHPAMMGGGYMPMGYPSGTPMGIMGPMGGGFSGVDPMQRMSLQLAELTAQVREATAPRSSSAVQPVTVGRSAAYPNFGATAFGSVERGRLLDENEWAPRGMGAGPLLLESEAVLEESMRATMPHGAPPGSLAAFLERGATPAERANLTDLVRAVEEFERSRGLTPAVRPPEADGCVTVKLGPSLRVELRFKLADH